MKLYRVILVEQFEDGSFPSLPTNTLECMEIERTPEQAKEIFYASAHCAESQNEEQPL